MIDWCGGPICFINCHERSIGRSPSVHYRCSSRDGGGSRRGRGIRAWEGPSAGVQPSDLGFQGRIVAFPDARSGCCVPELVRGWVDQLPSAHAVVDPVTDESLTYQQLWHLSGGLAAELTERGVARGEIVAVSGGRSVGMVVAMLGIARAGAAYLPLDAHAPAERLTALLEEAGTRFVVGDSPEFPGVRRVSAQAEKTFSAKEIGPDDPFYVNYTSGSTGRPKGVVVPHRAVVRLVSNPVFCTIEPGDRVANQSNPAFDATTFELWNTLTSGGTVVVLPAITDLRIDDWIALVRDSGISTMFLTTSLFHMVARERPAALRGLKTLIAGGEQMDMAATLRVLESGPPARLVNGYGRPRRPRSPPTTTARSKAWRASTGCRSDSRCRTRLCTSSTASCASVVPVSRWGTCTARSSPPSGSCRTRCRETSCTAPVTSPGSCRTARWSCSAGGTGR
ncbi:AMP-binding protein [Lentzea indica]|uniref:AMP-binding protein n=1 Tax=Lentzea indica TaxID=2604800 RepID=UPI0035E42725